ncbi:MAG TPA: UDP-N-acetylmuramyl peptide synthase [Brevibacillus sp.]|nr:UDP-N-acetylmuramoyl-tripeptide--D-alanyl-D-alanine ligase [Brevibacillus parabrevis]NRQ55510.1 UDP-N-acetylmuramoyl-tripeptide--D-alanyl-D-alanine ligase [Brevibacillus sp. HD1.4A]RNB95335.1 UDP-N-acetylmuramoyl-tripeptide--D-alanyl-D-alanine ligase [Brevibacillus parabrevis]HBZ82479.1 UDP-N-acetylmuramyl peptide synthase [Brevibacillus sp.]
MTVYTGCLSRSYNRKADWEREAEGGLSVKKKAGKTRPQKTLILNKPVIAVTGSAGKTTTKEMIFAILNRRMSTYRSMYNKNFLGNTRAHVKRLRDEHEAAVLEFGILRSGHIQQHCRIIQPNMGVITNIGTAHIGNFEGKAGRLAMAKSELIRNMKPTGTVFINRDCPYSRRFAGQPFRGSFAGRFVTFGIEQEADYRAEHIVMEADGISFVCQIGQQSEAFFIPTLGGHNVYNALAAIAVAHTLGIPLADIRQGLRQFQPQKKRLVCYRLNNNVQVLDDTYSSNPDAAKAAIDVLSQSEHGTKVAVLASMLEMGKYEVQGHEEVGQYLSSKNVDYLYTFGSSARHIARAAIRAGFPAERVMHCANKEVLHRSLAKRVKPDTTILVKGSHKLKMGETVEFLRKVTAGSKLPRRKLPNRKQA